MNAEVSQDCRLPTSRAVAHVGGGFLFLASHAVFGEIFKHDKALVLISFGIGFGTIAVLTFLLRLH